MGERDLNDRGSDRDDREQHRSERHEHHKHHEHHEHGGAAPVTFDQLDIANYLHADNKADGSATEQFVFQVTGAELHGAPVTLPGLGSNFGMYFIVDALLDPANGAPPHFSKLDVSLMIDPGNNDGAISATADGVSFANGTLGDFALAKGTLVSAALSINADPVAGTRHADFVEQFTPTEAGRDAFGGSLNAGDQLRELLTTLGSNPPFELLPLPGGDFTVVVNGGTGSVQLVSGNSLNLSQGALHDDRGGGWGCAGPG